MLDYRCYHVDDRGHIIAVEIFQVSSDSEACDRAQLIVTNLQRGNHDLWQFVAESDLPNRKLRQR